MQTKVTTRRIDGRPETAADRRFLDLRESGYQGPIDQDGYAVASIWPERDTDIDLALDEPIDAYPPNRWTGVVHKLALGLIVPASGAVIGELTGSDLLLWLSFVIAVLGFIGCGVVLVLEYRSDER
jgi:hypothetical protein